MATQFPLKDGVAVVTGAASGIGAATARALAARGCHLALCDRNDVGLAEVAPACAGVNVSCHTLDVADAEAVAALPEKVLGEHGKVTLLINNAGVALFGRFQEMTLADFEWVMGINLFGVVRLTHGFLPLLMAGPAGHIVNISSMFGLVAPPGQTAYCAAKFGVKGFSESLRHELDGSTVSLTVVHPGGVATKIGSSARVAQGMGVEALARARERTKALLVMDPDQAAGLIVGAIEARAPRLLIGDDCKRASLMQRLFPATYWKRIGSLTK